MSKLSPLELIEMYQVLLKAENERLKECLENIAEYAEKLAKAADAANLSG